MSDSCQICGNISGNRHHIVREMMYGLKENFPYLECANCGCLQLETVPEDLPKYYPDNYWQFQCGKCPIDQQTPLTRWLRRRRAAYWLTTRRDPVGRLLALSSVQPGRFGWLRRAHVNFRSPILDVGCGVGDLLLELAADGFTALTGVDPFISADISYPCGVAILKRSIFELSGNFTFVMLHHSFEHMPEPRAVLSRIRELLPPSGVALLRIPVVGYAWRKYGVNWAQIDAPRHLFLHTEASMQRLAADTGFTVTDVIYDSGPFQFWGSEQYERDIAMYDPRSLEVTPTNSIFSEEQIQEFRLHAAQLNEQRNGDQACFYLARR